MSKLTKAYSSKTEEALKKEVVELEKEITKLFLQNKTSPQKDTNAVWKLRRKKAVLLTVIGEKESSKK